MKKLSVFLLATLAMVSCGNTYKAQRVQLDTQTDSLNYALGVLNASQLRMYFMRQDSGDAIIAEFMDALQAGYEQSDEPTPAELQGKRIATSIKGCEEIGLIENPSLTLNEKLLFQGIVNGMFGDSAIMTVDAARDYFMQQYQAIGDSAAKAGKCIKATALPKSAKQVKLISKIDSINYAFGFITGDQVNMYLLANDTTGNMEREFRHGFNSAMRAKTPINAQMQDAGHEIGASIRMQEQEGGLMHVAEVPVEFDLIRQGFINGLYDYTEPMDMLTAEMYVNTTFDRLKNGPAREAAAQWMEENAQQEGVQTTASGLQYKVIRQGKGQKPAATDRVKVHYEGTLTDGTVFDSSYQRGEPISFALNQVIAGWTEGLQLMPVGSKYELYIPYQLGYGERGAGQSIPPFSNLIFTVELLSIEK